MVFRKVRQTKGKTGVKHAGTLLANIGPATVVTTKQVIIESSAGARQEAVQELQDSAFTDETCRTGDLIKYVNSHIQVATRFPASTDSQGWLEYAFVWKRESETDVTNGQLGTLTLGTICTNLYRNDCIWTGFIPVHQDGSSGAELKLKMPRSKSFLKLGEEFVLFTIFRSNNSASVSTDLMRVILSYNYKAYS